MIGDGLSEEGHKLLQQLAYTEWENTQQKKFDALIESWTGRGRDSMNHRAHASKIMITALYLDLYYIAQAQDPEWEKVPFANFVSTLSQFFERTYRISHRRQKTIDELKVLARVQL